MESSSEVKRSTHVISVQPNETVLTALPYGPHSSLLEFLKGEPKVLGAAQVLLALIIAGIGAIFALNYFHFAQRFPLVFLTGYPFWGALIFIVTGCLTGASSNDKCMGQGVTSLNVISSLVSLAGIIFTIISYRYQHKYCQGPSLEGICVIGRVLYNGILSVLLIISIAELSIAVTIASFRSNCWANSNEAVQILFGVMNFSFGIVLLFTLEDPYPRFPFIFISGYPFWSSVLFVNSGAFLVALERKTTETLVTLSRIMSALSALAAAAGIFLLVIGFLIDRDFLCGYAGEVSECYAVTTLFIRFPFSPTENHCVLIMAVLC
ncbi:membrane-spanning 4-domains subfamily A member 6D-like [Ovis canadensis]|uniref:membrane-spanning 4-domains subfamily A member 6D-like n=1 Tax=Ovis canadensis TaxID=37174 RepID=UPI00375390E0